MNVHSIDIGQGRPLIFQHGLTANASQIQNLLTDISDVRLMCIDCPGHGLSHLSIHETPSFRYYTQLVMGHLDTLDVSKAIIGGLSMGSGIALHAALHYPERVEALVLHRPAWLHEGNPENLSILDHALKYLSQENGADKFKEEEQFIELQSTLPAAAKSVLGIFSPAQQDSLPKVIRSMVEDYPFSSLDDLKAIKIPTLILANENDPLHPFELAETISKHIPQSQLKKIVSRYVNPDLHKLQVQEHISNFVKTL